MDLLENRNRSNWVQLNTVVLLRWAAIVGQVTATFVAVQIFDLEIHIGPVAIVIGALVIANLFYTFVNPRTARLQGPQATLFFLFDVCQLGVLLMLTGGLSNPFTMMMLAPVAVSSMMLPFRGFVLISSVAALLVSLMWFFYIPLHDAGGTVIALSDLLRFGMWMALLISILFSGVYTRLITSEIDTMSDALVATQEALAREQKLTDLAGVVAATAHEMGTPLATIKLISSELADMLSDQPDLLEDVQILQQQTDRCRDILQSMGRAGKDDLLIRNIPAQAMIEEAAAPHMDRGVDIRIQVQNGDTTSAQPILPRKPEIIHGLRNLIQNAVDFSETRVDLRIVWSADRITFQVRDDGPGFSASVIDRLGDPLMSKRRSNTGKHRKNYSGMGLGLFIAKTLLERTGARIQFANGTGPRRGAVVDVSWLRKDIESPPSQNRDALGENMPIDIPPH